MVWRRRVNGGEVVEELIEEFLDSLAEKIANDCIEWYTDLLVKRWAYSKEYDKKLFEEYSKAIKKYAAEKEEGEVK
jgi:hypothetical protein